MYPVRKLTDAVFWVGASDRRLSLFENLFPLPRGVAYNSYLILDEKTALVDTVDASVTQPFLENVLHVLNGRSLDYLVIDHVEPDHCAGVAELLRRFPAMQLVGSAKAFQLLEQFHALDLAGRTIAVKENDVLPLGRHTLRFFAAPMVHWPEVMMAYEEEEKLLFSADAFGSFGALSGNIFQDELRFEAEWLSETRRYYGNIVGKYGPQVQAALKKLSSLELRMICPLHGPIWRSDLDRLLEKYDLWSRYQPEEQSVALFYGSMYGGTEAAVNALACALADAGVEHIAVHDVSKVHLSELIAEVFRCSHLVLACPTYNNGIYPAMHAFLHDMKALNLQNRTVGLMENGSWAPSAGKQVRAMLDELKNITVLEPAVTIRSALNAESTSSLEQLRDSLLASLRVQA